MRDWISRINILAIIAGGLIAASFKYPWWSMVFTGGSALGRADIYPYIIAGNLPELMGYRRTAQMQMMVVVLIGSIVLCLVAGLLRGKLGRILLALVGLAIGGVLYSFYRRMVVTAGGFGVPVQGQGMGYVEIFEIDMVTSFGRGIYLLAAGGASALLASLLHPWARIPAKRG